MHDAATLLRRVPWWLAALVLALGHLALGPTVLGFWHWNLGAGLIFAACWLLPWRMVLPMMVWIGLTTAFQRPLIAYLTEDASLVPGGFLWWGSPWLLFIGNLADPLLAMIPAFWLRWRLSEAREAANLRGITLLHFAAIGFAVLATSTDVLWVYGEGFVADVRRGVIVDAVTITAENQWILVGTFALKNALGTFLGVMLVAPTLLWVFEPRLWPGTKVIVGEALLSLAPAMALFVALTVAVPGTKLGEMLRLLMLTAVVVFAVRHGWRGAVLSILLVSLALAIEDHLGVAPASPIFLQLFVAIAGAMGLLFGATVDGLREQARSLALAKLQQVQLTAELAQAAARSVRTEEAERGRIAMDLHDSLGQGITALQTQIKLAELEIGEGAKTWTTGLREVADGMRDGVRDVLEALRPTALRELGVAKSIDLGALRQMVERAGGRFDLSTSSARGSLDGLDEAAGVAAYRIVQEAVTNALRHGRANTVRVRLRVGWRGKVAWLLIHIEDDGIGLPATLRAGRGLQGMRDRALTLGGDLRLRHSPLGGAAVRAWFRAHSD